MFYIESVNLQPIANSHSVTSITTLISKTLLWNQFRMKKIIKKSIKNYLILLAAALQVSFQLSPAVLSY